MKYKYVFSSVTCGAAFIMLIRHYGLNLISVLYMLLILVLEAAALIDIKEQLISDKLVAACFIVGLLITWINKELSIVNAILGCLICGSILVFASFVTKGGIGMGDAKLFAAVGMSLGIGSSVYALMLSAFLSGLFGLVLLCISMKNGKKTIPFAPFILVSVIMVLVG